MNYNTLKIDELKELLKERGLTVTGRKQQLIQALLDFDAKKVQNDENSTSSTATCPNIEKESNYESIEGMNSSLRTDLEIKSHSDPNQTKSTICINEVSHLTEKERIELRKQKFGSCEQLTETEKRLLRSKRFGVTSEEEKKLIRRARFGMASEADKIKNRQERFGIIPRGIDPDHEKKIQARKLRFGLK